MSRANIWFVIDGIVVTPARNCLSGITRKNLHLAIGDKFKHEEREIHEKEISRATESFMTGTYVVL